jgi:hypothetical protein
VFDLRAARRHGVDGGDLKFAIRQGEVVRIHRGVYRFAAAPPTWEGDQLAACWAAGPRGFTSHRAAAEIHEVPAGNRLAVVITCPRWRRAHHDGIVVHECTTWYSTDVVTVDGIPVASPALTLLQLASTVPRPVLEMSFENVLRRRLATVGEIDALLRRYARRGRPGVRRLRDLVRSRSVVTVPTDSERETELLQVIRPYGLPEPVRQHPVRFGGVVIATVDLAYPDARIAIEYDSDEFHTGRVATAKDSERRHRMIAAGWLPVTAVSSDVRTGGALFARALRAALDDRHP